MADGRISSATVTRTKQPRLTLSEVSSHPQRHAQGNGTVRDPLLANLTVLAPFAFVLFVITGLPLVLVGRFGQRNWARRLVFRLSHVFAIRSVELNGWRKVLCLLRVDSQIVTRLTSGQ